jgi:glutathione S-transferase
VLARLEPPGRAAATAQRSQAWIDRQMSRVHAALKAMSQGLGDKPWCAGIHFTLADVAVGCALGYLDFRFAHIDWRADHPNLKKLGTTSWPLRQSFIDTAPQGLTRLRQGLAVIEHAGIDLGLAVPS